MPVVGAGEGAGTPSEQCRGALEQDVAPTGVLFLLPLAAGIGSSSLPVTLKGMKRSSIVIIPS